MRHQCEFCSSFAAAVVTIKYMHPKVFVCGGHITAVLAGTLELPGKIVASQYIGISRKLVAA